MFLSLILMVWRKQEIFELYVLIISEAVVADHMHFKLICSNNNCTF